MGPTNIYPTILWRIDTVEEMTIHRVAIAPQSQLVVESFEIIQRLMDQSNVAVIAQENGPWAVISAESPRPMT